MIGQRLLHYEIVEKLGEGGMGVVYKARDRHLDRFVAIKVLPPERVADPSRKARFVQEAKSASALNHPNIVTIHDISSDAGTDFIAMEYVAGKTLDQLISRKGMRPNEALKIAVQVADAMARAHAAGIVHRDLKPSNVMVDEHGLVKVLDFGLAKLAERGGPDEETATMGVKTEEGTIVGTVAYMSPEQAEGKKVDARSDIFSFGAVLYEIVTGRRAFQKESKASTLGAIIHQEPEPPGEEVPQELSRIISRCLRKDVNRRSQNMADVKLALEELREESESGKLVRSGAVAPVPVRARRWLWPAVAIACVAVATAALVWTYLNRSGGVAYQGPDLVRLSPDDGYSYELPSISADGKFVAYVSDRSGSRQVWLQQVAGGDPIQLTHSADRVAGASFFPDGARLLYATNSPDRKRGSLAVISTLGGEPRVLASTQRLYGGALSPDGRQGAYIESESSSPSARLRLMVQSLDGGQPRELSHWTRIQPVRASAGPIVWTSDSRYLLCVGSQRAGALDYDEWEWFALPVDGGSPRATGAGDALRAAGLKLTEIIDSMVVAGDRVLFGGGRTEQRNVWEIRLSPDSWRVRGAARQLTFGTENQFPSSISASGVVALNIFKLSADLYLIPISPTSGQPTGVGRRLTHDGRYKTRMWVGGDPGRAYFLVDDIASNSWKGFALDLESGKQTLVIPGLARGARAVVSFDGRQVAYSIPEGNSYSIRIVNAGAAPGAARPLCTACGMALGFSRDGRFLFLRPEALVRSDPKRKYTVRLLELASGKERPWLEHPTDSIIGIGMFGQDLDWVSIALQTVGSQTQTRAYLVPWREEPVPLPEWIEVKLPVEKTYWASRGNLFQCLLGGKLMAIRFDPKTRALSDPYEVKYAPGSEVTLKAGDSWGLHGPGMVFSRVETTSSVWLMKLPQ